MDPELVLCRGYWEDSGKICRKWVSAYKEIALRHLKLRAQAQSMIKRVRLACSLLVEHATFYDLSRVDECFYAEAVERENEYLEKVEKLYDSLDGDFPCGNEDDVRFARRLFSIREMAFVQMGLANELDLNDNGHIPPADKAFADEAFPRIIKAVNQPKARKGFLYECMGQYDEAIECYEAMGEDKPEDRIKHLHEMVKQS